jgi:hypothetical protein
VRRGAAALTGAGFHILVAVADARALGPDLSARREPSV